MLRHLLSFCAPYGHCPLILTAFERNWNPIWAPGCHCCAVKAPAVRHQGTKPSSWRLLGDTTHHRGSGAHPLIVVAPGCHWCAMRALGIIAPSEHHSLDVVPSGPPRPMSAGPMWGRGQFHMAGGGGGLPTPPCLEAGGCFYMGRGLGWDGMTYLSTVHFELGGRVH